MVHIYEENEQNEKPVCNLSDCDGNVYVLTGKVGKTLRQAGLSEKATEFYAKLHGCLSYDAALQLIMEYVEVM